MIETNKRSFISWRNVVILATACLVSLTLYIGLSSVTYRLGFPLDDAWIHQTYARNLGQHFEWSFIPGQSSGGSTSPLWTVLLALGHALRLGPYLWTYVLGWACLFGLAVVGECAYQWTFPDRKVKIPWVGLGISFEWHLAWAAGSGMETLGMGLLSTLVIVVLQRGLYRWWVLGLLAGVSVWLRPDGLTLLGPLVMMAVIGQKVIRSSIRNLTSAGLGFFAAFVPYAIFIRSLTGSWWPNTFYAKQAEYAILREQGILGRLVAEFRLPLVGAGVLLMAGFIWFIWTRARAREWAVVAGAIWWVGYIGLYAWRLPVTYQYGRYVMPAMPLFFIWGAIGTLELTRRLRHSPKTRIIARAWGISTVLVILAFWVRGAVAYANDVAIIETEMTNPARWIANNTPDQAYIAAHDIGALGYFGGRPILDLAGLISPEVIPIIRDEPRLKMYLDEQRIDYLVITFNWYPQLAQHGSIIYEGTGTFIPNIPVDNTRIYRWGDE